MKKCVLVTGSSNGIGKETARAFAKDGYNVAVNYLNDEKSANELCREIETYGVKAFCYKADVSDKAQVENMFSRIAKDLGGVDVLVNNAGISSIKMLCDVTEEEWDRTFDVNVKSAYLCSNAACGYMVHNKYGRIINVSSVWGIRGASCEVHYSASKSALAGFTKALAKELALSGITVNCVCPGFIDTRMNCHLDENERSSVIDEIPMNRAGKPEEVAQAILFFASEKASYITAQVLGVDGGWN